MPANLEDSAGATGLEKVSFHSNPKERQCQRMFKFPHNYTHGQVIQPDHASKVMLKILQTRLLQYVNQELPNVQAGFRKTEEPEIKLPTSTGSSKKQENSRKTSTSASFSSVSQSCPTLCDPIDCSTPGFPVHHQLLELAQTLAH